MNTYQKRFRGAGTRFRMIEPELLQIGGSKVRYNKTMIRQEQVGGREHGLLTKNL